MGFITAIRERVVALFVLQRLEDCCVEGYYVITAIGVIPLLRHSVIRVTYISPPVTEICTCACILLHIIPIDGRFHSYGSRARKICFVVTSNYVIMRVWGKPKEVLNPMLFSVI